MNTPSTYKAWPGQAWRTLRRLRLGVILLAALLGAVLLGALLPQAPQAASAAWWEAVRQRYGLLYGPLRLLGLFNLFRSWWFWGLLGLLALCTLACFTNRARPLLLLAFRPRVALPEARFEQAALRATLAFPSPQAAQAALSTALARRRYRLLAHKSGERLYLRADRHHLARLGTLLTHAGLVLLVLGLAWGELRGWRESGLEVSADQATPVGHGTGVALRCESLEVARYDDGAPRDYRASVVLVSESGETLARRTLRVNHPLKRDDVSYYLQGYRLGETCDLTLVAVYDPSYGPVVVAGLCLLLGTLLTFHLPQRRLWARVEPDGRAVLIGGTDWDRERFARQFRALANELERGT
jgi:cytochrome c biogenesis protein